MYSSGNRTAVQHRPSTVEEGTITMFREKGETTCTQIYWTTASPIKRTATEYLI